MSANYSIHDEPENREREFALSHAHALFFMDLHLCGCGSPEAAYELIRGVMALTSLYDNHGERRVGELIGSAGAVHIVLSAMTEAELLEHGSVIGWSWSTEKGDYFKAILPQLEWDDVDESGMIVDHECSDDCWRIPQGPVGRPTATGEGRGARKAAPRGTS